MQSGAIAIERIEIQSRRAKILRRQWIGALLVERCGVERDVVVDELAEIGIAGRQGRVVARVTLFVPHCLGKLEEGIILGMQRCQPRKHFAEFARIGIAGKRLQGFAAHSANAMPMGCDFRHRHSPFDPVIYE